MRILHFTPDEKFLPFVQQTFEEVYSGENEYRIPQLTGRPLKYFQKGDHIKVVPESYWNNSKEIKHDIASCDCLLVHYMNPLFAKGVLSASDDILVGWIGWGGDYYHIIEPYIGKLHLPTTQALVSDLQINRRVTVDRMIKFGGYLVNSPMLAMEKILNKIFSVLTNKNSYVEKVSSRIDFAWVNPEEMEMFELALPEFNRNYHRICYYSDDKIFARGSERMDGPDVLVGNSATPTNNHLELFEMIEKTDLGDRCLIVPLNYGDVVYAEAVERIGKSRFGTRFISIRNYMPLDEYYELLGRCGTVMMNHIRQQAGTTIATALYKGAKVYLRNENPVFSFYKKMGMRLWSIQDDLGDDVFGPISHDEMKHNRSVLSEYWGHERALKQIQQLEELVEAKHAKQS